MQADFMLDTRLSSAIPYVPMGATVADVGTDHAYLPIALMREGRITRALACDINEGPIRRAEKNILEAGFSDRISILRTDGLHGVEDYHPDCILIFGMGGELIAKILSEAPWIRSSGITLILQPMTRAEVLRQWLLSEGFSICSETLTREELYYQTLCVHYTGIPESYTDGELLIGKTGIRKPSPFLGEFIQRKIAILQEIVKGKERGSADAEPEKRIIAELEQIKEDAE